MAPNTDFDPMLHINLILCAPYLGPYVSVITGGGGQLVFRGRYHARVWPLNYDFGSTRKATLNKDFAKFSIP